MKEKEMYPILDDFLKERGFERVRSYRYKFGRDIGQRDVGFDVTGYKDGVLWIIECKKPCTVEKFGFALGQLMCYKFLIEEELNILQTKVGKPIKQVICSIALMETGKYKLLKELLDTFKNIIKFNKVSFGFITVDEDTHKAQEHIKIGTPYW